MIEFPICSAAAAFSIPRTGWQKVLKVLLLAADHCSRAFWGKMNSRMILWHTANKNISAILFKLRIPFFRSPRPGWGRPRLTATTPAWTWWTPRSTPSLPPGRSSRLGRGMTRNRYKTNIKSQGFIWGEMSGLVGRSWCVGAVYLTRLWLGNNATTAADTRNTPGGRASGPSGRAQDFLVGELFVPS